jgi:probable FeS assembly SUF system protein SufT
MREQQDVTVLRDVEAVLIPAGNKVLIPEGVTVTITQSLGGSHTVITPHGYLARVSGRDADALGLRPTQEPAAGPAPAQVPGDASALKEAVLEQLRQVYDPEIPINIVDLGLIYGCDITPEGDGHRVEIRMTMTAPGCGMGDVLKVESEDRVRTVPGVSDVHVEIVWEPPWDQSRMTEAARLELGFG